LNKAENIISARIGAECEYNGIERDRFLPLALVVGVAALAIAVLVTVLFIVVRLVL
jgi:hypothetical protein